MRIESDDLLNQRPHLLLAVVEVELTVVTNVFELSLRWLYELDVLLSTCHLREGCLLAGDSVLVVIGFDVDDWSAMDDVNA